MKKLISIIIPFYNEAGNLGKIYSECVEFTKAEPEYDFEIILMDNCSTDDSNRIARGIADSDSRVTLIRLSRNFGYQSNILTGYHHSKGDAAVQLDADGEDDPMLIREFLRKWEAGNLVVYGVRRSRQESFFLSVQRKFFYWFLNKLSSFEIPRDAGDFRLIDRKVVDLLKQSNESSPYIRGVVSFVGFKQCGIDYDRRKRYSGESKFSWFEYVSMAFDGITSFSRKPLMIVTGFGLLFSLMSFLGVVFYLFYHFFVGTDLPGFTTLILVHLFLAGIQLLSLGIIGTYVGRVFDDVKKRPFSVVSEIYRKNP